MGDSKGVELVLTPHLDQLLNAGCPLLENLTEKSPSRGGLILPSPSSPGTGNIIIRGKPGTCKTTLALQIAVEAVRRNDGIYAAYLSLEENASLLYQKAVDFDWWPYVWPMCQFPSDSDPYPEAGNRAKDLKTVLDTPMLCRTEGKLPNDEPPCSNDQHCPQKNACANREKAITRCDSAEYTFFPGKVILPRLEPSTFQEDGEINDDELFEKRYRQIEQLLLAAQELREDENENFYKEQDKKPIENFDNTETIERLRTLSEEKNEEELPEAARTIFEKIMPESLLKRSKKNLALVCVDSLNVLGGRKLTRKHLAALFDLFRRTQTIGVFIVEDHDQGTFAEDTPIENDTVDFLADTVIELIAGQEEGYFVRHFQIRKSRYQNNIPGPHPFKAQPKDSEEEIPKDPQKKMPNDSEEKMMKEGVLERLANLLSKDEKPGSESCIKNSIERSRRRGPVTGVKIFPSLHYLVREMTTNLKQKK